LWGPPAQAKAGGPGSRFSRGERGLMQGRVGKKRNWDEVIVAQKCRTPGKVGLRRVGGKGVRAGHSSERAKVGLGGAWAINWLTEQPVREKGVFFFGNWSPFGGGALTLFVWGGARKKKSGTPKGLFHGWDDGGKEEHIRIGFQCA